MWRCSRMEDCCYTALTYGMVCSLTCAVSLIPAIHLQRLQGKVPCKGWFSLLPLFQDFDCSEEKFCESNNPNDRPPPAKSDFRKFAETRFSMAKYVSVQNWDPFQMIFAAMAFACFNGAFVPLLALIRDHTEISHAASASAYCQEALTLVRWVTGFLIGKDLFWELKRWIGWGEKHTPRPG